ncbi:type II toxin-antitoxin system VapC family toxin [Meiothermus granaticius]|uniref:Ribonuclease VapC22 n=1 Tax=Meiothermus granaticius NBRC 107808 TaxID=1227551 RepID=A0A399F7C7_9DEIN|nr:type II toxin-antitoxin system VapC family toxin [Meiothermus granaticius]RIH92587.1 Ribonuclease VapC22 [Meiothermus granaticius NBRC 107808]GEM88066.1 twitching motility protein PilT [Meiothermus granaticius NBRC 107808]
MNLLLDSHIVLWWFSNDERLTPNARRLIEQADEVFVSAATTWELAVKTSLGRLRMPEGFLEVVVEQGFSHLPITEVHALAVQSLPWYHRDPFDRILLAQAIVEGLGLLSMDKAMAPYGKFVMGY